MAETGCAFFDVPVGDSAILSLLLCIMISRSFMPTGIKKYKIQRRHGVRSYVFFDMPVSSANFSYLPLFAFCICSQAFL